MQIYKMQPRGYLKSRQVFVSMILLIIAIFAGTGISIMNTDNAADRPFSIFGVVLSLLMVTYFFLRHIRRQWQSY